MNEQAESRLKNLVGGLASVQGAATIAMLPSADAIPLVSDAVAEYSRPELEFLRQAASICPNALSSESSTTKLSRTPRPGRPEARRSTARTRASSSP